MVLKEPIPFYIDDVVQLRKPHPCGSYEWTVVRIGADIGLRCLVCGRRVLLPRRTLEKRLKKFVSRGPTAPGIVDAEGEVSAVSDSIVIAE